MPTKNLVSDFGAVGDAQAVQGISATITSGTKNLAVGTAIFSSGDVGKAISLWATPFDPNNFQSTIATFTDSTHVVLADNCTQTLSATSTNIVWGTDNTAAFTGGSGWRAYAQSQTNPADPPVLQVPDGFYAWKGQQGTNQTVHYLCGNNPKITGISGNAAACGLYQLNSGEFRFGTNPAIAANRGLSANPGTPGNSVRLNTALAGATSVFLATPSGLDDGGATYGSRVVVGRACLIVCYDIQGQYNSFQGYPPNNHFYEWRTITAYNSGTGEVTLEAPLTQDYKSTYPEFGLRTTIFGSDQGGPATMWIAPDGFDTRVTLENMTLYSPNNQMGASIRHVTLNNITCVGPGLYPSTNDTFTATSCVYPQLLEVDKNVGTVTWNNCTLNGFVQQSVSPRYTYINGGTISQARGGRYFEMNNVAFTGTASLTFGISSYGRQDRAVINNCTGIATIADARAQTDDLDGSVTATNASDFYTFVGGVVKVLKSENTSSGNPGQANVLRCLAPGTWVSFDDKIIDKVVDVYEDGTYFYVQFQNTTSWPITVQKIRVHPCPDVTVTNCTGTAAQLEDLNQAPARAPLYSYSKRSYVATSSATVKPGMGSLIGRLSSVKFTPTSLYTGASLTFRLSQFGNWPILLESDHTSTTNIDAIINMKIAGVRNLVNSSAGTGAQSGDTLTNLTSSGSVWFYNRASNSFPIFSTGVSNGETPTIDVEIRTDQGIPSPVPAAVAPLRLRLRA